MDVSFALAVEIFTSKPAMVLFRASTFFFFSAASFFLLAARATLSVID